MRVTLVLFAAGLMAFERVATSAPRVKMGLLLVMVVCAATLFALQPGGPGFLMMFVPLSAAAFRFRRQTAAAVAAGLGLVGLAAAATVGRRRPVD